MSQDVNRFPRGSGYVIADALPDRDKDKVAAAGGTISLDSYLGKDHRIPEKPAVLLQ